MKYCSAIYLKITAKNDTKSSVCETIKIRAMQQTTQFKTSVEFGTAESICRLQNYFVYIYKYEGQV